MSIMKRILASVLSVSVIAGFTVTAQATPVKPHGELARQNIVEMGDAYVAQNVNEPSVIVSSQNIPAVYSSVELGYTTNIKDQGNANTCWAYATTSVFETLLNIDGKYTKPFSASHMDSWATVRNDGSGWLRNYNDGASVLSPTGYLASWQGPKYESDYPDNNPLLPFSALDTQTLPDYAATGIMSLTGSSEETIKRAIMKYGAVWGSYSDVTENFSLDFTSYYCNSVSRESGHAVTVVGWNDYYPAYFFTGDAGTPRSNGAWLVQNSWGEGIHNGSGYFWISYEDANFLKDVFDSYCIVSYDRPKSNNKIHQLETFGSLSYLYFTDWPDEMQFMNTYKFSNDEKLDKVIFSYSKPGVRYRIYYIPIDSRTGMPTGDDGKRVLIGSGTTNYSGYICADIKDYALPSGEGAISIGVFPGSDDIVDTVGVSYDSAGYFINPSKVGGECYVSYFNGFENYVAPASDLGDDYTFSIKAITYTGEKQIDPNDYKLGDVNADGEIDSADATYVLQYFAGIISSDAVFILKNADVNIDGYIDSADATIILQITAGII